MHMVQVSTEDTLEMERVSWKEKGMNNSLLHKLMIPIYVKDNEH